MIYADVCLHIRLVHKCVFICVLDLDVFCFVFFLGQSGVQRHPPTMTSVLTLSFLPLFATRIIGLIVGQRSDPLPSIRPPADRHEF